MIFLYLIFGKKVKLLKDLYIFKIFNLYIEELNKKKLNSM